MSRLSEGRISHLSHVIMDSLRRENLAQFPFESSARKETKDVLQGFFNLEDRLDDVVRNKQWRFPLRWRRMVITGYTRWTGR